MSLQNPKLFGLNVLSQLADVRNKNTALQNLGINPLDLDIIRGSRSAGMSRFDWISFSRLNVPLYKTLDRFVNESNAFVDITTKRAGADQTLFGNLNLNGSISGSAIRYRYVDFADGNKIRIADISTSRVSAWSSSDLRANNQNLDTQKLARISYGARVGIITDGKLIFGEQSTATKALGNASNSTFDQGVPGPAGQPRLQTSIVPEPVEFPSEVPTSRIKCKIGTEIVYLYAMKGIPLVFKGLFSNLNATVTRLLTDPPTPRVSWKIVETGNENLYTNYVNRGSGANSSIAYRSPVTRERFIKVYKNPNEIVSITITSASIFGLPPTQLKECIELNFANNQIKLFPNLKFIAEKLQTLNLSNNPLYLSDIESERKLNTIILNKIKDTLQNLTLGGSFNGSIERNIISEYLPDLVSLNLSKSSGVNFDRDDRVTGSTQVKLGGTLTTGNNGGDKSFCPDVPINVIDYNIRQNDFRSVDLNAIGQGETANDTNGDSKTYKKGSFSFKMLPNLRTLDCYGNRFLDDEDSGGVTALESANTSPPTIENITYSGTNLGIPSNLQNCSSLKLYLSNDNGGSEDQLVNNSNGNYAFSGCSELETISFYRTNLGLINFPDKFTNDKLKTIDLRYTNIKGGKPGVTDENQTNVIHSDTLEDLKELENFYILSSKLLLDQSIDETAFRNLSKLKNFRYYSYGRTSGSITSLFSNNQDLRTVVASRNKFSQSPPNFAANPLIRHVNLSYNQLDGSVPPYNNLSNLVDLFLNNNQLGTLSEPGLLPSLQRFYLHDNNFGGQVPDFSGCGNLRTLTLHRNNFTGYKVGSFSKLYKIRFIDLSFCDLTPTALNNILKDLLENWQSIKRGGVTINLKSQQNDQIPTPFGEGMDAAKTLQNNGWDIGITGGIISEN